MAGTTIKREAHTPTTDQSEDSGVDVSAAACCADDGRHGPPYKRKRSSDDYDGDGCPRPTKSNRTAAGIGATETIAVSPAIGCPPFRPWSCSDESSADVGLRLFHDIRNVDRILTLTQRHRREPPSPSPSPQRVPREPQPLDLTRDGPWRRTAVHPADVVTAAIPVVDAVAVTATSSVDVTTVATTTTSSVDGAAVAAAAAARNSKNMSRARRIEANARERSRVHTISAAFDTLRATVPSYSKNQKLSKLSTIRIASAYILTLSRLLDMDYSAEQDRPSVDECMKKITGIIHMEGKARKKKDE